MMEQRQGGDDGRGLVAFIPGTWMGRSSWLSWQSLFDRNGHDSVIVELASRHEAPPGAALRRGHSLEVSLTTLLADCVDAVSGLAGPPILIGHGSGAVLAQILLARPGVAVAAIALSPARAGWVSRSALPGFGRTAVTLRSFGRQQNRRITPRAFAQTYANTRPTAEALELYHRHVIPGSYRPLFHSARAVHPPGPPTAPEERPPLLLMSGGRDRLSPESTTRAWERYGRRRHPSSVTDHHVFPDRGHSLAIDAGSEEVANFCLDWLTSQNL